MAEREEGYLQNPSAPENIGSSLAALTQLSPSTPLLTNQVFPLPENQGTQSSPESMGRHSRSVTPPPDQCWLENHVSQSWSENQVGQSWLENHSRSLSMHPGLPENLPRSISYREYQPLHRRQFNPQPSATNNFAILNPDIHNLGRDLDRLRLCTASPPPSSLTVASSSILPLLERLRIEHAVRGLGHQFSNGWGHQQQLGHPVNFNSINGGSRSPDHRRGLNYLFQKDAVNNGFGNCNLNPDPVGVGAGRRPNYPFEDANMSYDGFPGNSANHPSSYVSSNSFSVNHGGSNSLPINNYGGSNSCFVNNGRNYGGFNSFSANSGCDVLNTKSVNALNGFSNNNDGNYGGLGVGIRQSFDGLNIHGNVGVGGSRRGSDMVDVGDQILGPNRRNQLRGGDCYSTSNHHHQYQLESSGSEKPRELMRKQLEEGNVEDIQMFLSANLKQLMVDQLGNSYLHSFFKGCSEDQLTQLLLSIVGDDRTLASICLHSLGSRAMQAMVEMLITPTQVSLLVSKLKNIAVTLCKSPAGHHVIKYCLKFFPHDAIKDLLNVIAEHCVGIATDKSGCCVLQEGLGFSRGETREQLVSGITAQALILSYDPYGNYVIQYVLQMKIPHVTKSILAQLKGNYVALSMDKFGSNVVEKCLDSAEEEDVALIIEEIIGNQLVLMVFQDPYGNYVAQSALQQAKKKQLPITERMVSVIMDFRPSLQSHIHGKRVLNGAIGKTRTARRQIN